jgi:hypothetical protein
MKEYAGTPLTGYLTSKRVLDLPDKLTRLLTVVAFVVRNGHVPRQYKGVVSSIANYTVITIRDSNDCCLQLSTRPAENFVATEVGGG